MLSSKCTQVEPVGLRTTNSLLLDPEDSLNKIESHEVFLSHVVMVRESQVETLSKDSEDETTTADALLATDPNKGIASVRSFFPTDSTKYRVSLCAPRVDELNRITTDPESCG